VMPRASSFFARGLGRTDLELAHHGDRVAVNDFSVKALGECERQRSLAAGGGPEDGYKDRIRNTAQRRLQCIAFQ
jgi:hypothetical protein